MVDEKVGEVMAVDPEHVRLDQKIRVLLRELENLADEVERGEDLDERLAEMESALSNVEYKVDRLDSGF